MPMLFSEVQAEVESWANSVNGKYIDFDGAFGAQCVDPVLQYGSVIHGYERILGHGIALAGNYISKYGWGDIPASRIQSGDMVSLNWGGSYGHVLIAISKLADGRWRILDQNSRGTGDKPSGPCEIRTVSLASGVVRVARPPRYMGATSAPPPPPPTVTQVLSRTLFNADAVVAAAARVGMPVWLAAAMVRQESSGRNIYGNDVGGIFGRASASEKPRYDKYVTASNYASFLSQLLNPDGSWTGRTSNGVGPMQLTYWTLHRDARAQGYDLSKPVDNIAFGLSLLAQYLKGDYSEASVKLGATRYNAGPAATTVNAYGNSVWAYALEYQKALSGATEGTDPAPVDPGGTGVPLDPARPVEADPGPVAELAPLPQSSGVRLPDPPPGPPVRIEQITAPKMKVHFRGTWWWPISVEVDRHLSIPGPDQSPVGAEMVEATGTIRLARFRDVTRRGWTPGRDPVPSPGEPVVVYGSTDDGETWEQLFTGVVDDSGGAVNDFIVEMGVVDEIDRLRVKVEHPAVGFRHPAPDDGRPYMSPGMHPVYVTNLVARKAGYYATSPASAAEVMVSVPMVGSMWPEHGVMFMSQTLKPKPATDTIASDSPDTVRVPWGVTCSNVFSLYRPRTIGGVTGKMDRPLGIRAQIGPTQWDWCVLEAWWDRESLAILVNSEGIRVEVQQGWDSAGERVPSAVRWHKPTPEQHKAGFSLDVWVSPSGLLSVVVDGVEHVLTSFPTLPTGMRTTAMTDFRITSRPAGTQVGGVVVVSSANRGALPTWDRTFFMDVDPDHMIWGMPALAGRDGLELLREQATAELSSMWLDEAGMLWYVSRTRMDARPCLGTIGEDVLASAPWVVDRNSVVRAVNVSWIQPRIAQNRFSSGHTQFAWEGPRETLAPGQKFETVVHVPDDTDWIDVDGPFSNVGPTTVKSVNTGRGSWLGGTLVDEDAEAELAANVAHYRALASRVDRRTFLFEVSYSPPSGEKRPMETVTAEISGLRKAHQGRGPVLRARGVQTWSPSSIPSPRLTGAKGNGLDTHEHDAGWWVQTQKGGRQIADRLALMLAQPIPTWGPVDMAAPDLTIRLGDTRSLSVDQVVAPQRVAGIRLEATATDGLKQTLTLRQLRP